MRVFVDFVGEGDAREMGMQDCVVATKAIKDLEALDEMISGEYTLEVSSPGVRRPLRLERHFKSHLGDEVEVKLVEKVMDRLHGKGKLIAVEDNGNISIDTSRGVWTFPLSAINKAGLGSLA